MKLIVGLGNPGQKYDKTRHNVGFMMLDAFAEKYNVTFKKKFDGLIGEFNLFNEKILLLKPETFMNLSGDSVNKVSKFYDINTDDILLIYDDLDLNFLTIKLKYDSSAGGHNGVKDIINKLHTQKLARIKIGISNEYKSDVKDFVLGKFNKEELNELEKIVPKIQDIILDFIKLDSSEKFNKIMNLYN